MNYIHSPASIVVKVGGLNGAAIPLLGVGEPPNAGVHSQAGASWLPGKAPPNGVLCAML